MKKSISILTTIGLLGTASLNATVLHSWSFNEAAGTDITNTINSASPGNTWSTWNGTGQTDISGQTTGDGLLRIQSTVAARESRVLVGDTGGSDTLFLHTRINSWEFADSAQIRLGFVNNSLFSGSSSIYAESRIVLQGDNSVTLQGVATENSSQIALFNNIQNEPLDLVLGVNTTTNLYTVHYKIGSGSWVDFFEGSLNPDRDPLSIRMYYTTGGNGEILMDIDSVTVSTTNPIPEPQTYALLFGVGAIGFVFMRRRFARRSN